MVENNGFKEMVLLHMGTMKEAVKTMKGTIKELSVAQEKFKDDVNAKIEEMHIWRAKVIGMAIAASGIVTALMQVAIKLIF